MDVKEDKILESTRLTRTHSAPSAYPFTTNTDTGKDIGNNLNDPRKNNYSVNNMNTQMINEDILDDGDKRRSSRLEIFNDRILGQGSFAKVFVAKYKGQLVAVKIVDISKAKEKHINQLKRELDIIRILRKHPHPNIPEYYKIIESPTRIIIVMEWCRGGELNTMIKSGLDMLQVKHYFSQILAGYLHLLNLNIVHRDMKAQNIMLTSDLTTIKIIDFGLSIIISTDMTKTVVGSPAYMAPERLNAQEYDSTSDIWSLGIILYEMIYQLNPFHACKNKTLLIEAASAPINLPNVRSNNNIVEKVDPGINRSDTKTNRRNSRVLIRGTESVPSDLLEMMKGMLSIDTSSRYDWTELYTANKMFMTLTSQESDKLNGILEYYRNLKKDAVDKARGLDRSSSSDKSDSLNDQMFDMDIEGNDAQKSTHKPSGRRIMDSKSPSGICIDGSECLSTKKGLNSLKTIPIAIPNTRGLIRENYYQESRNRGDLLDENREETSPQTVEYIGDMPYDGITGASVEEQQLSCLEDYFLTGDPDIIKLYENSSYQISPKKNDSGFADISFLDTIPFLQKNYRETKTYDVLKTGSDIGSAIYSKSAPVYTGISRLAKRAGSALTNIISPR